MCMVAINFYIAKELLRNSVGYVKNWQCDPLVFGEDDRLMAVAGAIWWFYISKSLEMLVQLEKHDLMLPEMAIST